MPICPFRFIGLSAQAGADLSVYRFIGLSAQAGKNRPCHHAVFFKLATFLAMWGLCHLQQVQRLLLSEALLRGQIPGKAAGRLHSATWRFCDGEWRYLGYGQVMMIAVILVKVRKDLGRIQEFGAISWLHECMSSLSNIDSVSVSGGGLCLMVTIRWCGWREVSSSVSISVTSSPSLEQSHLAKAFPTGSLDQSIQIKVIF